MTDTVRGFAALPDGRRLAYALQGWKAHGATPILLLRPLGGSMALWGAFADQLAREFPVLAIDYPGMGDSEPAPLRVTTRSLAEDALCVLDTLGIDRVRVFGISMGGMVATWLAHLAPQRVESLCLASTGTYGVSALFSGFREALSLAACFAGPASRVEPALVRALLSPRFHAEQPADVRRIEALIAEQPATRTTLLKYVAAAAAHNASRILPAIRVPTLVLAGADDHLLGPEPSRRLAERIPGAKFEIVPGVGHALTLEDPQGVAARVAAFFR